MRRLFFGLAILILLVPGCGTSNAPKKGKEAQHPSSLQWVSKKKYALVRVYYATDRNRTSNLAPTRMFGFVFPTYRLVLVGIAVAAAIGLHILIDRTRLGAMIRAAVDDPAMARVVGIRVSRLFTIVFALGAGLAGFAGVIGAPILSVYPGLDQDMLPLALVVVILGGTGRLLGSLVGSFVVGFLYNFGQAMFPELAYVVLFLPMLVVLVIRPQGLFGRVTL